MKPEIEIYGSRPLRFSIDRLTVEQNEGMHDAFTAYLANPGDVDSALLRGSPCRVVWGQGFAAQSMYGYIDTPTDMTGHEHNGMVLLGLGASSAMRNGQARSWRRSSPFRVARTIVAPYRMSFAVDKYVASIDAFMQSDESDWSALVRLAAATGMSLVSHGTSVRLLDVRKTIGRSMLRPAPLLNDPDSFVQLETSSPVGYDKFEFNGIDRLGSPFAMRGGQSNGIQRHSGQNFQSLEEARLAAVRHEDRERHYVRALAEFKGLVNISSGSVCVTEGD